MWIRELFLKFFNGVPIEEHEEIKRLLIIHENTDELSFLIIKILLKDSHTNTLNEFEINKLLKEYKDYIKIIQQELKTHKELNFIDTFEDIVKNHFHYKLFGMSYDKRLKGVIINAE